MRRQLLRFIIIRVSRTSGGAYTHRRDAAILHVSLISNITLFRNYPLGGRYLIYDNLCKSRRYGDYGDLYLSTKHLNDEINRNIR